MISRYIVWNAPFHDISGVYLFALAAAINWSLLNSCRAVLVKVVRIWIIFQAEMLLGIQNGGVCILKYLFVSSFSLWKTLMACDAAEILFL